MASEGHALKAVASNTALLKKILLYHVIPGSVPAAKVVKLSGAKTAEGKRARPPGAPAGALRG